MNRRNFLETVVPGALCAGALASLAGCSSLNYVAAEQQGSRLVVRKADLTELPYAFLKNPQGNRPVFLVHEGEDAYTALLAECTHRSCLVEPAGDRLACSCHGSEFTFAGEVLEGPAERPLPQYPVTADADLVYVDLS